jgi:hypothetical protein
MIPNNLVIVLLEENDLKYHFVFIVNDATWDTAMLVTSEAW